jgi:hypothetical protein
MYSGHNGISPPLLKNALFGINISQEPGLLLLCRFFFKLNETLSMLSNSFSLAALTVCSLEALP